MTFAVFSFISIFYSFYAHPHSHVPLIFKAAVCLWVGDRRCTLSCKTRTVLQQHNISGTDHVTRYCMSRNLARDHGFASSPSTIYVL